MSWSMSSVGTKAGVRRSLLEQKVYGTAAPEEQAAFDYARDTILKIVDSNPDPSDTRQVSVFDVSASGHGVQISNISVKSTYAWRE